MKGRLRFAILVGALAIAVPASAWAFAARDYSGNVSGNLGGFVGFDVGRNAAGKRVATTVTVGNVPYTCDTAPRRPQRRLRLRREVPDQAPRL